MQTDLEKREQERREAERAAMREAVLKGAALLDRIGVRNWRDKITGPLEMNSTYCCILGQAYRDSWERADTEASTPFRYGLVALKLAPEDTNESYDERVAADYGFDTTDSYEMLATTWHELLKGEL